MPELRFFRPSQCDIQAYFCKKCNCLHAKLGSNFIGPMDIFAHQFSEEILLDGLLNVAVAEKLYGSVILSLGCLLSLSQIYSSKNEIANDGLLLGKINFQIEDRVYQVYSESPQSLAIDSGRVLTEYVDLYTVLNHEQIDEVIEIAGGKFSVHLSDATETLSNKGEQGCIFME